MPIVVESGCFVAEVWSGRPVMLLSLHSLLPEPGIYRFQLVPERHEQ